VTCRYRRPGQGYDLTAAARDLGKALEQDVHLAGAPTSGVSPRSTAAVSRERRTRARSTSNARTGAGPSSPVRPDPASRRRSRSRSA
jgi:hypothetical protein